MEGQPSSEEKDSKKKESYGTKSSTAEAIGAIAFEPKESPVAVAPQAESFLQRLRGESAEEDISVAEASEADGSLAESNPLENLSAAEKHYADQKLVTAAQAVEQATPPAVEVTPESTASIAAVNSFREKIVSEDMDSEQALAETLAEINAEFEGEDDIEPEPVEPRQEDAPSPAAEAEPEAEQDEDEDKDEAASPPPPPPPPPTPPKTPPSSAAPPPPRPPYGGLPPYGYPGTPAAPAPTVLASPRGVMPGTWYPSRYRHHEYFYIDPYDSVGTGVLAGLVGYLVGRRRGRIKTEKRLLPVQKKLEQRVDSLKEDLSRKEAIIREAAAAKLREQALKKRERSSSNKARRSAVESLIVHTTPQPEHIGHVLMGVEAPAASSRKSDAEKPARERASDINSSAEKLPPAASKSTAEALSRAELLEMSSQIIIEGSSLCQVYETHLISEKGLRRVVAERLQGGDVRQALRNELLEHEIDFERDPILRDRAHQSTESGGKSELSDLMQHINAEVTAETAQEMAVYKAQAEYKEHELIHEQRRRHLMDVSLAGTIVVLLGIILFLILSRN
jgi:hypothetical protein